MNYYPCVFSRVLRAMAVAVLMATSLLGLGAQAQESGTAPLGVAEIREAIKTQLPPPPLGFDWHLYKNTVFLQALNWIEAEHVSSVGGVPMAVYSASAQAFSVSQPFEMGITVQTISGARKARNMDAKDMAVLYLKPYVDAHTKENVLLLERSENADTERTVFRYRDTPVGSRPVIVHKFVMASNDADTVHVFTFQSPETTWGENWKAFGKPFLGKLVVLPNVPAN
ncbi:MAG: hypothetical protein RIR09_2284 [Pseudomonadota bacterium]|jgi:hypothetical protein